MVRAESPGWWMPDTMTIRSAAVGTIALTVLLSTVLALAGLFVSDINDRAYDIVTKVLLSYGAIATGLMIWLRLDTLSGKADEAKIAAANAAENAAVGARKAAVLERKVDKVHEDVLNGPMRENVRKAIEEFEDDPVIMARRIELFALGVQKDRHDLKNRESRQPIREQLEARGMPPRDPQTAD